MEYDEEKLDDMVLALPGFSVFEEDEYGARSWKSHDWDIMGRLHNKGYISNPVNKAKSVVLSPEGLKRARELLDLYFAST